MATGLPQPQRGFPHGLDSEQVLVGVAVREIDPGDIQARPQ